MERTLGSAKVGSTVTVIKIEGNRRSNAFIGRTFCKD